MDIFKITDVPVIPIPAFPDLDSLNIFSIFSYFFKLIGSIIGNIGKVVVIIYNLFVSLNTYISSMVDGISQGNYEGIPILQAVGGYRYLVGDFAFILTYSIIMIGCAMTIFKLITLILNRFHDMRSSASSAGSGTLSVAGMLAKLTKFLK